MKRRPAHQSKNEPITGVSFPLSPDMHGADVGTLQAVLRVLIDRGVLLKDEPPGTSELPAVLDKERSRRTYGPATQKLVVLFQQKQRLEDTGNVDERTADALNSLLRESGLFTTDPAATGEATFEVVGTVRHSDGFPATGVTVSAFDRDLRTEQFLGRVRTGVEGTYKILYSARQFLSSEKDNADIIIKVLTDDESVLVSSPILFKAPASATIDLSIPIKPGWSPSLYERITSVVRPLLEGIPIEDLEENQDHQDITFLAGETGFNINDVSRFALAHKLARQAIEPEFWFVLLGGSFHQFDPKQMLADQLTKLVDRLPSLDDAAVRKALTRGFNLREIPEMFRAKDSAWVEAFLDFIADRLVKESPEPAFVRSALLHAGITDPERQTKFARLYNQEKALTPTLLAALEKDISFQKREVDDLKTSFRLAELTDADFTVVQAIKEEFDVRQPANIRSLAKRSAAEWSAFAKQQHEQGKINLPFEPVELIGKAKLPAAETFGRMLETQFREAFPTATFAGGLERALGNGGAPGLPHAESLSRFLAGHAEFELLNTSVDEFLNNGVRPDFRSLARDDSFRSELKGVQRVFKLAPNFEASNQLLADSIHSAQKVYRLGRTEFVRRYGNRPGFTPESARLAWNRAAETHAAVLTIVGDLRSLDAESLPLVLKGNQEALSTFPNWDNLFRAGDLCECEHCRSVLSPAAYFADLLVFLKDRSAVNPAQSVKDILFQRRPDIGYLELDCANALTTIPYVDVVCEVLEDVVAAGENDLELEGLTVMAADMDNARNEVTAAFAAHDIALDVDFHLSQVASTDPDRWVVHGHTVTYLLKKKATPNFFVEVLRNTKATAEELRAYPQYVNPVAYASLREARHPFTLPFDLFAEEVRAACEKSNLQRWDLMRTLRGSGPPNNPSDADIAAEYFGISSDPAAAIDERRLIFVPNTTVNGQRAIWGEPGNPAWLSAIGNVRNFLLKTRLAYNDVLSLLDLEFINPDGDIAIHHQDASCDTDRKVIQVLDATRLDRIHRFLRLLSKLEGWKDWELDLVVRHPAIGNGSIGEPFLIQLFYFVQLKEKLGKKASVEHVCAMLGDLNTRTRFTALHEKRQDALYQGIFLNKKLISPLDAAFQLDPITGDVPAGDTISAHHPVFLAALGIREPDLMLLREMVRSSNGQPYITDDLSLATISFLWRHAWLAAALKYKTDEWAGLLNILQQDVPQFASPQAAWEFIERLDQLADTGFKPDELNWVMAADRTAKAAAKEADAARFLAGLRQELKAIQAEHDVAQYDFLTATPPTEVEKLAELLLSLLSKLNRDEAQAQFFLDTLEDDVSLQTLVAGLPAAFDFPAAIRDTIRIRYDEPAGLLRFTGLMTPAERLTLLTDASLVAVTGNVSYQDAIEDLFIRPRLALKFFESVFTAPLQRLPEAVDFRTLEDDALARRVSFDAEQRLLRVEGILSSDERAALDALSADPDYRNAVNSLATQPVLIGPPDRNIWLLDGDLQFPLRDLETPANDNLAQNIATAASRALVYLSMVLSENAVVQQAAVQLGVTEALTGRLFTHFEVMPGPLMPHFTTVFAATNSVIDYATLKPTFDGWFWCLRVAALWNQWKITAAELDALEVTTGSELLDITTLPLDDTGTVAFAERLIRTSRLLHLRDTLPETGITLLEILQNVSSGAYATAAEFASDVQLLNDSWLAMDVETLVESLDLDFPDDYLLAESWERLRRAFHFLESLNAGAATALEFAAAVMTSTHAQTLKDLMRSKFGADAWLALSTEIQDALRERKRDALTAFLLTRPQPADAPTGKWENTNDLYAYYLLDVEMASCQLTSRLVQGSGSVQLFVQRCFMGLEPDVRVETGGDEGSSAWNWWQWMSKYRVWEANRKVFLWPENWIEPELKKDRSPFFKELENELLQNEINSYTVETAYQSYLEKLDGVRQLEIAGFFQEDDGDNTIVHVFGRTTEAEPHIYYYRRFDYRQWTPWEKVDLDIQGDYLIPAVVNKRLFLFWPVFTEIPDEAGNSKVVLPKFDTEQSNTVDAEQVRKKLRMQLAMSDYRLGKWTPRKISKDAYETSSYIGDIRKTNYRFYALDLSSTEGRFAIRFEGFSQSVVGDTQKAHIFGAFELGDCTGVPRLTTLFGSFVQVMRPEWDSAGDFSTLLKWPELLSRHDAPQNDFSLQNTFSNQPGQANFVALLLWTPWQFNMAPPWHLSYLDRLWQNGMKIFSDASAEMPTPVGAWLPYFYKDKRRTFFVLPSVRLAIPGTTVANGGGVRYYYPDVKKAARDLRDLFEGFVRTWVDDFDLASLSAAERQEISLRLQDEFHVESMPPYTDDQLRDLATRYFMRPFDFYIGGLSLTMFQSRRFHFKNHYHPFVCDFAKLLHNPLQGIPALMARETQLKDSGFRFLQTYQPTAWVVEPPTEQFYPEEVVDFTPDGSYSPYNWELFFHAPLLIANSLSKNQRFEEARDWYHFIFNPAGVESAMPGGSAMSKYWITKPFFETTSAEYIQQRIENLLRMIAGDTGVPGFSAQALQDLEGQVLDWRTNPFEPHRIANYRTVAYQKTVVMKYLDNLIAWGDYLFRQDSMESINEATQLYVMAAEILGPRPHKVPPQVQPPIETFNELEEDFDAFSNALIEVENLVPQLPGEDPDGADTAPLPMLYFCIPQNDKLLSYWDTVEDRLYKIRHCMNIEGVVRQLALFEPPIDPGALVKAVAGGMDIASALADLGAPLPLYRFNIVLQKANEVCNDVKGLGAALLGALEKKDAEELALVRQNHEIRLLEAQKSIREDQIEEMKFNLDGLTKSKELAEIKKTYYEDREFMNAGEIAAMTLSAISILVHIAGTAMDVLGGVLAAVPDVDIGGSGFGGSPVAKVRFGGIAFSKTAELTGRGLYQSAAILDRSATIAATVASYQRRQEEWDFQKALAEKEIEEIDEQINAMEIRVTVSKKELENHKLQISNAKAADEFMRSKYTNLELYQWQIGQVSSVYFQSYKLAYDLAKRAERCFRFELGLEDSSYIKFGYWDSLKKGLMAAENLQYDLRRLETAYIEQNRREFELTKHVSLTLLDPLVMVRLRETGRGFFRLPEEIFDLDFPGHYFRRIKSVSLTLPCVTGPYTTIACTLRLLKNSIRIDTTNGDNGYARNVDDAGLPADDERFIENNIPVKATASSGAQNDSGMFEVSFRDERYLPFEGAGVISEWSLELFNDLPANNPDPSNPDFGRPLRQFDYSAITDAILHIKYSAREDAGSFKNGAVSHLREYFSEDGTTRSLHMLSLRRDFPSEWSRFLRPLNTADGNIFRLNMSSTLFPFRDNGKTLRINTIILLARCTDAGNYTVVMAPPLPQPPPAGVDTMSLARNNQFGGLHFNERDVSVLGIEVVPSEPAVEWTLRMSRPGGGNLQEDPVTGSLEVTDMVMVLGYEWE